LKRWELKIACTSLPIENSFPAERSR
jgi:hypothetical protein